MAHGFIKASDLSRGDSLAPLSLPGPAPLEFSRARSIFPFFDSKRPKKHSQLGPAHHVPKQQRPRPPPPIVSCGFYTDDDKMGTDEANQRSDEYCAVRCVKITRCVDMMCLYIFHVVSWSIVALFYDVMMVTMWVMGREAGL